MTVVVTGGTGLLGRSVVERLLTAGHEVRVVSRDPQEASARLAGVDVRRGDLTDPESLPDALSGAEVVVRLVHVSIVGVDRIPVRFYRAKREAEALVEAQSVPWTVQRATQFHPFVDRMIERSARLPVLLCPRGLRFQPVAVEDVAARLVEHVATGPSGRAPDLGGPEVLSQDALARTWLRARRRRRLLVPTPLPGSVGRAFRAGANLAPDHRSAGTTWQEHLDRAAGRAAGD